MRRPLRDNRGRQRVAHLATIPAPVGGWDARNPLADMPAERAVVLDNWIPRPGYVELRRGFVQYATTGATGTAETLLVWKGPASEKMFAAAGSIIYDVTSASSVVSAVTGLSNARFQYVNMTNSAGDHYIVAANGADTPRLYNGTSWATASITGSGLTPSTLIDVMVHKRRVWFVEKDTTKLWYLASEAIQGAATKFDLGPLFSKGGHVVAGATWSLDGGSGLDDYAVWITSNGQAAVYQGTDPSSATTWALVGVFEIGRPLGRRCLTKFGGDLAVLTDLGILPFGQILSLDRTQYDNVSFSQNIQNAYLRAARDYGSNFGWQAITYPRGGLAIVNVPIAASSNAYQYVMNTQTGAWCRWKGMNAFSWGTFNGKLYFGGLSGKVYEADRGSYDDLDELTGDITTAYQYFGARGQVKRFTMLRPIIEAEGTIHPAVEMSADFKNATPTAQPSVLVSGGAKWGTGIWGSAQWAENETFRLDWTSVTGIGIAGAATMRVQLPQSEQLGWGAAVWGVDDWGNNNSSEPICRLYSFDVAMERGAGL